MATGKGHAAGTLLLSPITVGGVWWLTSGDVITAIQAGAGCLSGLFISPDLDMETITISEYWLVRWTLGLGWLWVMLWYPYALIAKHRSWLSHTPIIGTLGRVIYLGLFYLGLGALLRTYFDIFLPSPLAILSWPQWLIAAGGLAISDFGHWWLDK